MNADAFNNQIRDIINAWCERKDLPALAGGLLSAWIHNNGLTDGWHDLCQALRTASNNTSLPAAERDTLKRLWIDVDTMLRSR
jgi:hypothetical protein